MLSVQYVLYQPQHGNSTRHSKRTYQQHVGGILSRGQFQLNEMELRNAAADREG